MPLARSGDGLKAHVMRALIGSGFTVRSAQTRTNYFECIAERVELLGVRVGYYVIVAEQTLNQADAASAVASASHAGAALVVVSAGSQTETFGGAPVFTVDQFMGRLGGPMLSLLPLQPEFADRVCTLGLNQKLIGLVEKPDTLFEEYVHAGLQFLVGGRVIKYGQERLFEAVPDGVAMMQGAPLFLYDAKAYKDGYPVTADSIRQFADYVRKFHGRYEATLGRLTAFLVISGKFADSDTALENRSREFLAEAGVSLAFLSAKTLSEIVALLVNQPLFRRSINWAKVLARPIVSAGDVDSQLKAIVKDGLQGDV